MKKKKSNRYQNGGKYNYDKSGNTNITAQEAAMLSKNSNNIGFEFTPEFASSFFSKNTAPPQAAVPPRPTAPPPVAQRPIKHIQAVSTEGYRDNNGLPPGNYQKVYYTDPNRARIENQDYEYLDDAGYNSLKKMNNFRIYNEQKNAPQQTNAALSSLQYGGDYYQNNTPYFMQNPGASQNVSQPTFAQQYPVPAQQNIYNPESLNAIPNQGYQAPNYSQNFAQNLQTNNPIPNNFSQYSVPPSVETPTQNANPLAADAGSGYQTDENGNDVNQYDKTRFYNQYSGFDIPSAAYALGQGIETGNTLETVASGLKLATGLGRNIVSGMGQANRRKTVLDEYNRNAVNASRPMTQSLQNGGYFQEGGMQTPPQEQAPQDQIVQQVASALQGGADPQQILQSLITSGIPQEDATALIQGIIQQLQQQAPQEEVPQAQYGGTSKKKVDGEHIVETPNGEKVAEVENKEYIKTPDGEVKQAIGETHQNGGIKLTEEQLPNGSQIISDHLKVGKDGAKKFNEDYDLGIKSTDTYAKVIDKFNSKSGIKKIVEEQELVLKNIEKQTKKLEENPSSASTIKLNLQLYTDQLQELQEQKAPLEEARKVLFDEVFKPQEESKQTHNFEAVQEPIPQAQNGGLYNGDMILSYAKKYNLHPDRVVEIMQHANGGIQQFQDAGTKNIPYTFSTQYTPTVAGYNVTGSSVLNQPTLSDVEYIQPYTGKGYGKKMEDVEKTINTHSWYFDTEDKKKAFREAAVKPDSGGVVKDFQNAYTQEIVKRAKDAGLNQDEVNKVVSEIGFTGQGVQKPDDKFGAFTSTRPVFDLNKTEVEGEPEFISDGYTASGTGRTRYTLANLPDQSPLLPDSLQGALKQVHRYDRIETPLVSPDQAIVEIRRQEQSAMQGLQNLPDAQRAAAVAQIQANTQSAINNAVAGTTSANQGAKFNTDVTNAQIQMREEDMRNKDLTDYEAKILKADAITQANLRNFYNANQKVNTGNFNYIQGLNLINDRYDNAQFTGDGTEYVNLQKAQAYDSFMAKTAEQRKAEADAEIKAQKKLAAKSKKRFGGTK